MEKTHDDLYFLILCLMIKTMDVFSGLNQQQKQAALATEGPVLILAGAGSGKTKTLTHRIAYLIQKGVKPDKILAITFTNKAAEEMKKRISVMLDPENGDKPFIGTFHGLGVFILKNSGRPLNIPRRFTILDEEDSLSIFKNCLKELNLDSKQFQPAKVKNIVSRQKNNLASFQDLLASDQGHFFLKTVGQIWQKYEEVLTKQKALDFDDLILKVVALFQNHPDILKQYQNKWHYIHIDEYQDTNRGQYLMAGLLAKNHKNICAVGDDDQSIYSFRGAEYQNILNFEKDWPNCQVVTLEENYRSSQTILDAANKVINKNKARHPKNLFTQKTGGEPIYLFAADNEEAEARFAADEIEKIQSRENRPSQTAVLYRTNFQSRVFEEEFLRRSIPYQVLGIKFYQRKEIKDILAYLKSALNPDDFLSQKRIINVPARSIGKITTLKFFAQDKNLSLKEESKIQNFQKILKDLKTIIEENPASKAVRLAMQKSGYQSCLNKETEEDQARLANLKELVSLATKYDHQKPPVGIETLISDAALAGEQDSLKNPQKGVKMMTVHAAKGLEFDNVFLVGLEEGLFPIQNNIFSGSPESTNPYEEERRLFYVALTRAKNNLYLSFANFRRIFGDVKINAPSRFLSDIPEEFFKLADHDANTLIIRE